MSGYTTTAHKIGGDFGPPVDGSTLVSVSHEQRRCRSPHEPSYAYTESFVVCVWKLPEASP